MSKDEQNPTRTQIREGSSWAVKRCMFAEATYAPSPRSARIWSVLRRRVQAPCSHARLTIPDHPAINAAAVYCNAVQETCNLVARRVIISLSFPHLNGCCRNDVVVKACCNKFLMRRSAHAPTWLLKRVAGAVITVEQCSTYGLLVTMGFICKVTRMTLENVSGASTTPDCSMNG